MDNRIKTFRIERGLTMQALAEKCSTTASQINKLEKGERRLTADWMYRIAEALDIAPSDLFPKMDMDVSAQSSASDTQTHQTRNTHKHVKDITKPSIDEEWHIPHSVFETQKNIVPQIVHIHQKDLEPELCDGDYVVINTADNKPTQPGIFVTKNEQGEYLIQFCKLIFKDGEEQVQFTHVEKTDDGLKKTKIVKLLSHAHIQGRIIAHWHWM